MSEALGKPERHPDDRIGGYFASFLAFAGITGLWAFVTRSDEFYETVPIFGVDMPATTMFYLLTMPFLGFVAGRLRYEESDHRANWFTKSIARALNFMYSHLLIVLFTTAMATEAFFGWNLDAAVQTIDDRLFDVASRFAPWLAAYLAGFNLGRATGVASWRKRHNIVETPLHDAGEPSRHQSAGKQRAQNRGGNKRGVNNRNGRAEPTFETTPDIADDAPTFKREPAFMEQYETSRHRRDDDRDNEQHTDHEARPAFVSSSFDRLR